MGQYSFTKLGLLDLLEHTAYLNYVFNLKKLKREVFGTSLRGPHKTPSEKGNSVPYAKLMRLPSHTSYSTMGTWSPPVVVLSTGLHTVMGTPNIKPV